MIPVNNSSSSSSRASLNTASCLHLPLKAALLVPISENGSAMVVYNQERALRGHLSIGASFYANATKRTQPAIEAKPAVVAAVVPVTVKRRVSQPMNEPEQKPKKVPILDEDGFEVVTNTPQRRYRKKKSKVSTAICMEDISSVINENRIEFLQDRLLELATRTDVQDALLKLKANDPGRKLVKVTNKETGNVKLRVITNDGQEVKDVKLS